jgi:hypothetical protein
MHLLAFENANRALAQLARLAKVWHVIDPVETIRVSAKRFLRVHDLRAADALQLAAAFVIAEGHPASLSVTVLDHRLTAAAQREGFEVIDRAALLAPPASSTPSSRPA